MNVVLVAGAVLAAISFIGALPLGLTVSAPDANTRAWRRIWPVVGVVGAVAIVLPAGGGLAAGAALFYASATAALALSVPARLVRPRPWPATEAAVVGALLSPLVGGVLLAAERLGALATLTLWWAALATAGAGLGLIGAGGATGTSGEVRRPAAIGAALLGWVPAAAAVALSVLTRSDPSPTLLVPVLLATALTLVAGFVVLRRSRAASGPAPEPCSAQTCDHELHGVTATDVGRAG